MLLVVQCADQPGIVSAIARAVAYAGGNILDSAQFADQPTNTFSLRIEFDIPCDCVPDLRQQLLLDLARFDPIISLRPESQKRKVLLMVTTADHCLLDILYHYELGELPVEICGVISNQTKLQAVVESAGLSFVHLPVSKDNKAIQESKLLRIFHQTEADFLVLARYMQVLSDDLCKSLAGRVINIHHSFLPGFKGAKPYLQAFERGVKLIGATAHYVTADLDEGPIIEQDVVRVNHKLDDRTLMRIGRDVERRVLTRAIRLHAEDRVLLVGNRTVVFE